MKRRYISIFLLVSLSASPMGSLLAFQGFGQGRGYPVVLHSDTLFYLYADVGSYTAAERARVISRRIDKLYRAYIFNPDSLTTTATPDGYDIVYESDFTVMSIAKPDALRVNTTPDSLAATYRAIIIREIGKEKKAGSFKNWVRRIGLVAAVLAGLVLCIYGINLLFRRSAILIRRKREVYARGFTFRKYRILSGEQLEQFVLRINRWLRLILLLLSVYLAVLLLSGVFTATEKWTDMLLGWILTPAKAAARSLVHFLPNLFTILVIYFIIHYSIKVIKYFSGEIGNGNIAIAGFHRDWAQPTFSIVRFLDQFSDHAGPAGLVAGRTFGYRIAGDSAIVVTTKNFDGSDTFEDSSAIRYPLVIQKGGVGGGTAVGFHGYFRLSHDPSGSLMEKHDLDFWYNPTYDNYLIASKRALGRTKDIDDIDQLHLRRNDPE